MARGPTHPDSPAARRPRAALLAVLALGGCDLVLGFEDLPPAPRRLVLDGTALRRDAVDVPVLVALDADVIAYEFVQDPLTDLRFYDEVSGDTLPHEIERWSPGGESLVWTRVPRIPAGTRTEDLRLAAEPGARSEPAGTGVWDDHALVLHDGTRNVAGARYQPRPTAIEARPGVAGDALGFSLGSSVEFEGGQELFSSWATFTLEFWLYPDYPNAVLDSEPLVVDQGRPLTLGRVRGGDDPNPDLPLALQLDIHLQAPSGAQRTRYLITYVNPQAWAYVAYTFDGRNLWVYRNGILALVDSLDEVMALQPALGALRLGDVNRSFTGALDEVRVAPAYRDPDYVLLQYLSMTRRLVSLRAE